MPSVKLKGFLGTVPKTAPELLPDMAAQIAKNCKVSSGDLIPYPAPVVFANSGRTGTIKTLYGLRNPSTNAPVFLTWATDVNIATPATDADEDQRFYYTGDGVPKVSTYTLATSGTAPYPSATGYYELGLPLPTTVPTTVATSFTPANVATFARDAGNNVTITTSTAHNLKSGAYVTISGFTFRTGTYSRSGTTITVTIAGHGLDSGASIFLEFTSGGATSNQYTITKTGTHTFTCVDTASGSTSGDVRWSIGDLNVSNEVTVIDSTTLTYNSVGPQVTTTKDIVGSGTYARTSPSSTVTVTSTAHGLATNDSIWVNATSGGLDGSASDNTAYTITVTGPNTFTFVSAATTTVSGNISYGANRDFSSLNGKVDLGGQTQARTYLYTWYTPWDEESIGSEPSTALFIREGQIVTVSNLPTAAPSGQNFVRGIRLYRSLSSTSGSDYYRLKTLWFPNQLSTVARSGTTVTLVTSSPHNFVVGDRFKVSGLTGGLTSLNESNRIVLSVVDRNTITYTSASSGAIATTSASGATLYYDVAEKVTDTARYWGDGGVYTFTDDFSFRSLLNSLPSTNYEPPPTGLQGLTVIQNSILAGFVENDLYFSEPGVFHAWPSQYRRSFESKIVGLAQISGALLVLTEGYPYVVEGNDPATMAQAKLSSRYPCTSRRSIVEMSYGVVYASHDGLVVFSSATGAQLLTRTIQSSDSWTTAIDPDTVIASMHKDKYFASHSTGSFILEIDEQTGASFIDYDFTYTAARYEFLNNRTFIVSGTAGDVYEWDNLAQPNQTLAWKSKVLVTPAYNNLGAARVVADYTGVPGSSFWESLDSNWEATEELWDAVDPLTFKLWVNKQLIFTTTCSNSRTFRMPPGYKADTFEVAVESAVRVRAIHLGETPVSLREV